MTVGDGANTSYAGVITGTGTLDIEGGGALTLSAANAFRGATTIGAGTLILTGATSGSHGAVAADAGALVFAQTGSPMLLVGAISGTGGVTQQGSGALTLIRRFETYSGTTTISSGTLVLTGDTSQLTGGIVDDAALAFAQTANSSLSAVISGYWQRDAAGQRDADARCGRDLYRRHDRHLRHAVAGRAAPAW